MPKATKQHTFSSSLRTLPYPNVPSTPTMYRPRTSPLAADNRQASSAWSPDSDAILLQARQQGLNWQPIASLHFPGKTANACRKRYERLIEKQNAKDSWDGPRVAVLAKAYTEVREQMWTVLADKLGEKWGMVEAKCMEKGLKPLLTAARQGAREADREALRPGDDSLLHDFRQTHRSPSHPRDSEAFRDEMTGHDPINSPFTPANRGHDDDFPTHCSSSAHTSSSSRFPTPNRTFSTSTFPPYTPTLSSTSPSFPLTTSPTTSVQPPIAVSQGYQSNNKLPSLSETISRGPFPSDNSRRDNFQRRQPFTFPSLLTSSLPRHQSPKLSGSIHAPVTTH